MPHIRFTRDRRGYEHTFLVRGGDSREGSILYWFRTPPDVRVGRVPLDESSIRAIEQAHPDVRFDWTRILQARPAPQRAERSPDAPPSHAARSGEGRARDRTLRRRRPRPGQPDPDTAEKAG